MLRVLKTPRFSTNVAAFLAMTWNLNMVLQEVRGLRLASDKIEIYIGSEEMDGTEELTLDALARADYNLDASGNEEGGEVDDKEPRLSKIKRTTRPGKGGKGGNVSPAAVVPPPPTCARVPIPNAAKCVSWGDPHINMFNGHDYHATNQATQSGVFELAASAHYQLKVHVYHKCIQNAGVAVKFGNHKVQLIGGMMRVDGGPETLPASLTLTNGVRIIVVASNRFQIEGPMICGSGFASVDIKFRPGQWNIDHVHVILPQGHVGTGLCFDEGASLRPILNYQDILFEAADAQKLTTALAHCGTQTIGNRELTGPEHCEQKNIPYASAAQKCAILQVMGMPEEFAACQYDYCATGGNVDAVQTAIEEWFEDWKGAITNGNVLGALNLLKTGSAGLAFTSGSDPSMVSGR